MPGPNRHAKKAIVMLRLAEAQLALVDRLADETCESRSAALRLAIRAGLTALGISR